MPPADGSNIEVANIVPGRVHAGPHLAEQSGQRPYHRPALRSACHADGHRPPVAAGRWPWSRHSRKRTLRCEQLWVYSMLRSGLRQDWRVRRSPPLPLRLSRYRLDKAAARRGLGVHPRILCSLGWVRHQQRQADGQCVEGPLACQGWLHTCTYIHTHTHTHIHILTYIHVHTHTNIHIHTHTYTYIFDISYT